MQRDNLSLELLDRVEYWNNLSDRLFKIQQLIQIRQCCYASQQQKDISRIEEKLLTLCELAEIEKSLIGYDLESRKIIKCQKMNYLLDFSLNTLSADSIIREWFETEDYYAFWSGNLKNLGKSNTMEAVSA